VGDGVAGRALDLVQGALELGVLERVERAVPAPTSTRWSLLGLLSAPAATAHRLSSRPWIGLALSALFALGSVWSGLSLAYVFPTLPPSTMVTAVAVAMYAAAMSCPALARLTRVKP
jgi:hypothetical protein